MYLVRDHSIVLEWYEISCSIGGVDWRVRVFSALRNIRQNRQVQLENYTVNTYFAM
jgi:hypothetical protein